MNYESAEGHKRFSQLHNDKVKPKYPDIHYYPSVAEYGLRKDKLCQGGNSGYQAINLAYMMGAERVLLLGYDMSGTGSHFFGRHPKGLSQNTDYRQFLSNYRHMNPDKYGLEVINCSRQTALDCFPRMDINIALKGCI